MLSVPGSTKAYIRKVLGFAEQLTQRRRMARLAAT